MEDERGGEHPLLGTGVPGDFSVDSSANNVQDESDLQEPHMVEDVWGQIGVDTQGPAGAAVPDLDELQERERRVGWFEARPDVGDVPFEYEGDEDAPQDAHGPRSGLGEVDFTEADFNHPGAVAAAEAAAHINRTKPRTVDSMLDSMEAAEAAYQAAHPTEATSPLPHSPPLPPSPGKHFFEDTAPPGLPPSTQHNDFGVSPAARARVVARLREALAGNAPFAASGGDAGRAGVECEAAIFGGSRSKSVYQSVASNAVRVAATVQELPELLRIASGEPRGDVADERPMEGVTGLQGFVLKPEQDL